jgi:hypothetical protein
MCLSFALFSVAHIISCFRSAPLGEVVKACSTFPPFLDYGIAIRILPFTGNGLRRWDLDNPFILDSWRC